MEASTSNLSTATDSDQTTDSSDSNSFATDPRIHINTLSGKWTFEQDDGTELEWEVSQGIWVPVVSFFPSRPSVFYRIS